MTLNVHFWGTRGSRPTATPQTQRYGGHTSCVTVTTPAGHVIALDAGTGLSRFGTEHARRLDALLLITHTHWDHIQGLPFVPQLYEAGNRIDIRGPRSSTRSLSEALHVQMSRDFFPISLEEAGADLAIADIVDTAPFVWNDVTVTPHPLHHPAPTLGFRIDCAGTSVVYATDNELRPLWEEADRRAPDAGIEALIAWATGADLLIHDTQYTDDEYPAKRGWGHSCVADVLRLADAAGVESVALSHHDPDRSDDDLADSAATLAHVRPGAWVAGEGMSVSLAAGEGAAVAPGTAGVTKSW